MQYLTASATYFYRAHTKYDAKVMFSQFLSFCSQGGGAGDQKLKNAQNVMGSPKNALKFFKGSPPPSDIATTAVRGTQSRFELPPCSSGIYD